MIQIDLGMRMVVKLDPFSERNAYVAEVFWKPEGAKKRKSTAASFNDETPVGALRKLADWLEKGGWDAIRGEVYPPSNADLRGPGADTAEAAA